MLKNWAVLDIGRGKRVKSVDNDEEGFEDKKEQIYVRLV